jgi:DMSO/TMAO reductase YedYZ molybdopterin-dependent catalytic subunit
MAERRIGRAAFLGTIGLGGLALAFGERVQASFQSAVERQLPSLAAVLPLAGWRIYAINPPWPVFEPAAYRLQVTGEVERPLDLSWAQVTALPSARQTTDFHCVTGWTVNGVHWQGVRLRSLWDMARPTANARYVRFVSMERDYVDTLTLEQSTLPEVMLAHHMDGAPLTRAHGAPLRLVIPEMYGYKNVKWLSRIELTSTLEPGYWEQNGYDVDAWVGRSNGY